MKLRSNLAAVVALAATALASVPAMAQSTGAVDVTSVVSTIAAQATPIASIGGAVLAIIVGIKAFKWVRRAM
jgi:uncharacterized membrane protein